MNNFEVAIGIEIHLELNTLSKAFSDSKVNFLSDTNTNVNLIDLGFPGSLPILNKKVVKYSIKLSKALNMDVDNELHFDRKHYFYPDLPKGFQITQQRRPVGSNGNLEIEVEGIKKNITIERIHIEEDTAKQTHCGEVTKINYNRAGVPLLEIVTDPVIRSAKEAVVFVDAIRQIAKTLKISNAKLEEGSLRADINISLKPYGRERLGTKVEIKNMNSLSNIEKAIEFEIELQTQQILAGKQITSETKRFDSEKNKTIIMRKKTSTKNYKYFPEPNIPVIKLEQSFIDNIIVPELPWKKRERLLNSYIDVKLVENLMLDLDSLDFFESIPYVNKQKLAKIFFSEIVSLANSKLTTVKNLGIDPKEISEALKFFDKGVISGKHIKKIIPLLVEGKKTTKQIIDEKRMKQISDKNILLPIIDEIINKNLKIVKDYYTKPTRVIKYILGSLMKKTKGQANPIIANKLVINKLKDK